MWNATDYLAGYMDATTGRESVDCPTIAYTEGWYDGCHGRVVQAA